MAKDARTNEDLAMSFLSSMKKMPLRTIADISPYAPTGGPVYQYVDVVAPLNVHGFAVDGRLVAASSLQFFHDSEPPCVRLAIVAVDPAHRRRGLGDMLAKAALSPFLMFGACSVMSMPDGEPEFVRTILKARCKETSGVNTHGQPILYFKHPNEKQISAFALRNYQQNPPDA